MNANVLFTEIRAGDILKIYYAGSEHHTLFLVVRAMLYHYDCTCVYSTNKYQEIGQRYVHTQWSHSDYRVEVMRE